MASPNHDANHLRLSRKIQDPVAAAATDGKLVSSALRNDYLNRASTFIRIFFRNRNDASVWLQGLAKEQSLTFASAGVAVPSDYSYFLSLKGTSEPLTYVQPEFKEKIALKQNRNWKDVFTVESNLIFAYQNYVVSNGSAGTLKYIKTDNMTSAGNASDIAIGEIWYDILVDIAATYLYEDRAMFDFAEGQSRRTKLVLSVIGQ